ncbi:MAG TPA: proton-conducting transporter membrane subunit [Nitrospinota bacterium]|nr:proton-conducting transporter membrane subunit [Nitrospinota bacterium]
MIPYILLQIVIIPVIASIIIFLARYKAGKKAGWIAAITLIYTTILLCIAGLRVYSGEIIYEKYQLGPEVSLNLLADGLSLPIALIINLICVVLAFYSIHYVEHRIELIYGKVDKRTWLIYYTRFFFLYLFFPAGFMGVSFATNLISMYFFLELLTIVPLYFIMAQFGYSDFITRYKVALMCLFWGVIGATFFLIGILIAYTQIGSYEISELPKLAGNPLTFWIALIILLGLATKLAIVPFHVWMPWVHAEHPTCIAGLLAVYANIAVYVVVRVLFLPLREDLKIFCIPLLVFALITMVYGSLLALAQTDAKRFCACSTISQISYSVFGIGALTIWGIEGGIFYFLSHILGKAILFSTAGVLVYTTGTRDMREMGGLWSKMPITAILWISASLILSALPPTSGFVGKWILFIGAFKGMHGNPLGLVIVILAILSTILTLVYTFLVGIRIFFGPLKPELSNDKIKDPPLTMSIPLLSLAVVALVLGLYPKPFLHLLSSVIGLL